MWEKGCAQRLAIPVVCVLAFESSPNLRAGWVAKKGLKGRGVGGIEVCSKNVRAESYDAGTHMPCMRVAGK